MDAVSKTAAEVWDAVWGCVPHPEQAAADLFLLLEPFPAAVAYADLVDALFIAASPSWWDKRLAAWRGNWGVGEETVEIEEALIRVYVDTRGWRSAISDCRDNGGCSGGDDFCFCKRGSGSPAS